MNQHTRFNLPICLAVEEDAFYHSDDIVKRYIPDIIGQKTIIISEEFLIGIYKDKIMDISRDFGDAEVIAMKAASFDEAVSIAKRVCVEDVKVIIGIGGGRVLDTAKYAAHISKAVYICMPTSLSNDSLASPFSVLETYGKARKTFACKIPTAIIVDTNMIINAPEGQTLSGIGDTIAKHTALFDWKLSASKTNSRVDDFAYALSRMSYDSVYHCDEKDMKSRVFIRILSRALVMGGLAMEIAGSSRPCSGSEHLFAHAIEEYYPDVKISHGLAVALGSIPACIFQGQSPQGLLDFFRTYKLDIDPRSYGITEDMFADIWDKARTVRTGRITILDDITPDRVQLNEIYSRMVEGK
ncbi:iron-containing alcohol dehydrogenase family protein [Ruminococcus flavefaciens]|uniref:iron-containing alcohol dehydrogenase family protein n=1 Tax=Ruminococcus flavefaciens TaxID=1265 RepID=UPI0026EE39B8|nr:iron-containing alcohol dehydrogenase family protein [Ruminococcus flavefaciens]MDD7515225.1 iron-containing alcohol dehydrogenase family protein [Ruminococcus flavefaciens]MDY5693063.1 iron-containing alcohol dehydrogenase family protein [Ruminococcus flavefaciens]